MFKFSKNSEKILNTVNKYLALTAREFIKESAIDISIADWGGLRSAEYQNKLYKKGWSKADGFINKSKHQLVDEEGKSKALDLCAYYKGEQNWNKERLCYIGGMFISKFKQLKKDGMIPSTLHIHWGGLWGNSDDGLSWDLPHYQLSTHPQVIKLTK